MAPFPVLEAFFFLVFFFVEVELVDDCGAVEEFVDCSGNGGFLGDFGEVKHLGKSLSTSTLDSVDEDWELKALAELAVAEDILAAADILETSGVGSTSI